MFFKKTAVAFHKFTRNSSSLIQTQAYINGKWVSAANHATFEVLNPVDGAVISSVPNMEVEDANLAIKAAKNAFASDDWKSLTGKQRSSLLKNWFRLVENNTDEIAEIMTAESGKPIMESKAEVGYGNSFLEWYAEEARRIYGEVIPSPVATKEIIVMKQPLGVVGLITPWNFPLAMITRKAAAALAAGCTCVIKPAEDTPLTALALGKLAEEAGIPKGVINIITSKKSAPIGELLCKSRDIQGISFTGSTQVGKLLYRNSADTIKRISLELGGNAPFIVFESANIEKAVDGAMTSKFRNCGQTCVSSNRFFVQESIYDCFVELLKQRVESLKIGDGKNCDVQIGPLINQMQFDKVSAFVEDAVKNDGKVVTGGKSLPENGKLFYMPTIITDVKPTAKLCSEEVFGPIINIIKFKNEKEVVKLANASQRGLAGYFYSENVQQIFRVCKKLELGMIGVNEGLISTAEAPFGGVKESGIGREGCHHGIDEYVEIKYICLGNLKYF